MNLFGGDISYSRAYVSTFCGFVFCVGPSRIYPSVPYDKVGMCQKLCSTTGVWAVAMTGSESNAPLMRPELFSRRREILFVPSCLFMKARYNSETIASLPLQTAGNCILRYVDTCPALLSLCASHIYEK